MSGQPADLDAALPRIRSVFAKLAEGAADRDLSGEHPYELVRELAAAGFGRLRIAREYGGFDVDLPTLASLLAEAGEADSNVPQIWRGHFTTTEILRLEIDDDVRRHWSTVIAEGAVFGNAQSEPSALVAGLEADPARAPLGTRLGLDSTGNRVVSGTKFYSTGSRFADYIRAAIVDDDGSRRFVVLPARHPGVDHVDDWDGIGQRQTGSGTTVFREVPVEPHGDIGFYLESLRGLDSFVQLVHLANLTGIARGLVAETVEVVRSRTRTSRHALTQDAAADPDVLAVVGTLHARKVVAESLLVRVAKLLDDAHRANDEHGYAQTYVETSAAQVAIIEAVLDAATRAFDAGGSSTARANVHLDRHWRNARTLASHNPVVYKRRVIGDFVVNGHAPESGYYADRPSVRDHVPARTAS